ncbi:MAG: hypothetical protein CK427_00670 [Leptospira sp.]|jgi:hypothetical protein|nr:MAG: hypothetical protein CK427_00670 [Leptospira sp.]
MQDKPTSTELLEAIQDFLMKEIMPTVKDKDLLSFKTLISWNMLGVIIREIKQEEPLLAKEFSSIIPLLGEKEKNLLSQNPKLSNFNLNSPDLSELSLIEKKEILLKANELLAKTIREEKILPSNKEVYHHIMETLKDKLSISNPRYGL